MENKRFYDVVKNDGLKELVVSNEFEELFSKVADLIIEYRKKNNGSLPKGIWLKLIELSGSYLCAEIIVRDEGGNLYLKKRDDPTATDGESLWEGQLHIPGLSLNTGTRAEEMVKTLLVKEILKDESEASLFSEAVALIGFVRYSEPERKTVADTLLFEIVLDKDKLQDGFYRIDLSNTSLIDQHIPTIEWYKMGAGRPWFFDTRLKA